MTAEWDEHRASLARKYLRHIAGIAAYERRAKADYNERLRTLMEPAGVCYEGRDMPRNPNMYADAIPDGIAEADEVLSALTVQLANIRAELAEYRSIMLDNYAYGLLLHLRHVEGLGWDKVESEMAADPWVRACSASWCRAHEKAALVDMYEHMPHKWREPRQPAI